MYPPPEPPTQVVPPPYGAPSPPPYGAQPPPPYGEQASPAGPPVAGPQPTPIPPPVADYGQAYPGGYAPQGGYAQPYPTYAQARGTNTMAILSLVLALVFAPAGVICGHIAKRQIAQTGEEGSGLATAGLVIGYIQVGLFALGCCIFGIALAAGGAAGT